MLDDHVRAALVEAPVLHTRREVLARPSPVPRTSGIYAWFFRSIPPGVDAYATESFEGMRLLYTGVSPGRAGSTQTIWNRVRYHYGGNAYGSTLRLTLGILLGLELRRVGSGKTRTFHAAECDLDEWMAENALVAWVPHPTPLLVEAEMTKHYNLPLNLAGNQHHPFYPKLTSLRKAASERAESLPVLPRTPRNRRPDL